MTVYNAIGFAQTPAERTRKHDKSHQTLLPVRKTGSNLHWGWVGLGTRLLPRTSSFPSPTYPLLIAPVSPTSRGVWSVMDFTHYVMTLRCSTSLYAYAYVDWHGSSSLIARLLHGRVWLSKTRQGRPYNIATPGAGLQYIFFQGSFSRVKVMQQLTNCVFPHLSEVRRKTSKIHFLITYHIKCPGLRSLACCIV